MEADVRDTENADASSSSSPTPLSCVTESCSNPSPIYESQSDMSSVSSILSLPSYVIVQRQMQDIVQSQQAAMEGLARNNISALNESKASFDMVVSSQEQKIKMLEKTIMEDYVPKEMYDSLRAEMKDMYVPKESLEAVKKKLQLEYDNHRVTAAKLQEALNKLDASRTQVINLTKQMDGDRIAVNSLCESLRKQVSEAQGRNRDLESQLIEKSLLCDEQQCQIAQQMEKMEALEKKQQTQTVKYKHLAMEADVKKQQEVYLSQIFGGRNKKKS